MLTQTKQRRAEGLIAKLGGARKISEALAKFGVERNPSTVYRWFYPRNRGGTGGAIPLQLINPLMKIARAKHVAITPKDLSVFKPIARKRVRK